MSSLETRYQLKRPVLVYVLAVCFIAAPLGDIAASMVGFGVYQWYNPATFLAFLQKVSWVDRTWLLLTMLAGIALLNQRKWSWILAISSLVLASTFNMYYSLRFGSSLSQSAHFILVLFMLSNLGVIVILYHFRFPYLDRREAWWGVHPRYNCRISVTGSGGLSGTITNISRSGAFVVASGKKLEKGQKITLEFQGVSDLEGEVAHASDKGFGIQFAPTRAQKIQIRRVVKELAATPMGEPAPV